MALSRRRPLELNAQTELEVPPTAAYAVIADLRRRPDWMVEIGDVDVAAGQTATPGLRFDASATLLGHTFLGRSEIQIADPGVAIEEQVVIGARFTSRWTFEANASGHTVLTHHISVDYPGGVLGRIERVLLSLRLRRMQRQSLRQLTKLVAEGD